MQQFLDTAISAARTAGEFIAKSSQSLTSLTVEEKGLNDYVSEVDRGAEEIILNKIKAAYPTHSILGEEFGKHTGKVQETEGVITNDFQWIVDPLDGTTNFLRSIPHYAVSIALKSNNELLVGVVYDPAKDEMYTAVQGEGAFLNGQQIYCSSKTAISGTLLATGIPFSGELLKNIDQFTAAMEALLNEQTSGVRRLGAAALDLAYVAAGRYDGFWEASLKPWDIAAGALLVKEAGGKVSDFNGLDGYLNTGDIVACSTGMHSTMQAILKKSYKDV